MLTYCNLIERVACYPKLCRIVSIVLSWRYSNLSARDLRAKAELALIREGRLAVTGDIEAMYHMTYVYEQDRNMLRFLWSNGLNDSPEDKSKHLMNMSFNSCSRETKI